MKTFLFLAVVALMCLCGWYVYDYLRFVMHLPAGPYVMTRKW